MKYRSGGAQMAMPRWPLAAGVDGDGPVAGAGEESGGGVGGVAEPAGPHEHRGEGLGGAQAAVLGELDGVAQGWWSQASSSAATSSGRSGSPPGVASQRQYSPRSLGLSWWVVSRVRQVASTRRAATPARAGRTGSGVLPDGGVGDSCHCDGLGEPIFAGSDRRADQEAAAVEGLRRPRDRHRRMGRLIQPSPTRRVLRGPHDGRSRDRSPCSPRDPSNRWSLKLECLRTRRGGSACRSPNI